MYSTDELTWFDAQVKIIIRSSNERLSGRPHAYADSLNKYISNHRFCATMACSFIWGILEVASRLGVAGRGYIAWHCIAGRWAEGIALVGGLMILFFVSRRKEQMGLNHKPIIEHAWDKNAMVLESEETNEPSSNADISTTNYRQQYSIFKFIHYC